MFSEKIRRLAYWSLDYIKGQPVRKHLKEITEIMEDPMLVDQHQALRFKELLKYSIDNVPFYKEYSECADLTQLPVINKTVIKENMGTMRSPVYDDTQVFNLSTSGSTGTPFSIAQDKNKRNRVLAEMMYFWGKAGYQIGMKYVFFRIWTEKNRKSKISAFSRNLVMKNILTLDEENLESIRKMLKKDKKIKMLLGYASTFENLVDYLIKCGDTQDMFNVKTIISGSEVLSEQTREKLISVFGCPVYSFYSNQENGALAQENDGHTVFNINTASYIVEILKMDSDMPAEEGELGRIVVTDLYNKAMPLIRYDTGDLAVQNGGAENEKSIRTIKNISGRAVDMIYTTDSTPLSPHTWSVYMWKYDKLKQYQFVQNAQKDYVMIINGGDMYTDEDITEHLKKILGNDANIKIERVDEIPVLASGKFKKTVCNYKKI